MENHPELKVGVEIHQQLDTKKLFCNCESKLRDDKPNVIVKRRLNAVAGETGKIDVAAEYEQLKKKEYIYEGYNDATCEVELDESPPREINSNALKISLQIALLLNAKILPIAQVMRKTVVDGSNTSGFQRTMLVAKDGYIETKHGGVKIEVICLEEDAARRIKQDDKTITFRLDRLGIPLVEVTTDPSIKTPEQAKEVSAKIGEILRACKVKRGIGTIRQDLNVNIPNHPRIEIKGFQDLRTMPKTIEKEIERQKHHPSKEGEVRKANADATTTFTRPLPGAARMYPETDLPIIKITKEMIDDAKKTLPKLKTDLVSELKEKGLSEEFANLLIKQDKLQLFNDLLNEINKPKLIAKTLTQTPLSIKAHHKVDINKLTDEIFIEIFNALKDKKISQGMIEDIMLSICKGRDINELISKFKPSTILKEELEKEIKAIVKEKPNLSMGAYMGILMKKFKGKVDGKKLMEILKRLVK